MTKKRFVAILLCVTLVALAAIGATFAYLTSTDSAKNTFTVGNVKIDLIESSLHRENAGVANGNTSTSELWSDVAKEGTGNDSPYKAGDTFYTDAQIEADAAKYDCTDVKLLPGEYYHKMPYVKNIGTEDAYIRIRVMIPADLDTAYLNSSMYTTTALNNKEFTMAYDDSGTVERDGVKYNVYTFTRIDPLTAGKLTYWNVWGTIHMDTTVDSKGIDYINEHYNGTFPVLVEADGIQSAGFADAAAAWAAFDKQA